MAQLIPFIKLLLWNRLIHQPIAILFKAHIFSGQIIAISHDLGPEKVASWKGNPLIQGKSMLLNYYSLARSLFYCFWDTFIKFFVCQHCVSSSTFNPVPPLKKDTHTHKEKRQVRTSRHFREVLGAVLQVPGAASEQRRGNMIHVSELLWWWWMFVK